MSPIFHLNTEGLSLSVLRSLDTMLTSFSIQDSILWPSLHLPTRQTRHGQHWGYCPIFPPPYHPRGLLNTSIPQYLNTSIPQYHGYGKAHHPPPHPTSTFSWRGGGCTSCTARAASSIPPYLHTIPHTILPLPFHGEAAVTPRVPPARPPQYLNTSFCKPWLIVWSVTLVFFN